MAAAGPPKMPIRPHLLVAPVLMLKVVVMPVIAF